MKPGLGSEFEGYRIESVLGEGGFAVVYEARDPGGRQVALKILTPPLDEPYDAATVGRFEREVAILSSLRGPHIITLLDHGRSADGRLFIVFERLPGQDLVTLLEARGRLAPAEVIDVLRQLLHALDEAHRAGLLHRDIKPHNVRVVRETPRIELKLLDFGIARATDDGHPSVTKTGEIVGTPRYMSPEQLMAEPLGPASDIYSLGIVAVELLMGRDALASNDLWSQVARLKTGHLFSMPELERVHSGLLMVIQRMTARSIDDRYASARAVLTALDRLKSPVSTQAHSEPHAIPLQNALSRRTLTLLVTSALAFIGAVAFGLAFVGEPDPVPPPTLPSGVLQVTERLVPPPPESAHRIEDASRDISTVVEAEPPPHGSPGCGAPLDFEGRGRLFGEAVHTPTPYNANRAHPLLVLLHHKWDRPRKFIRQSGFEDLVNVGDFIILAPANDERGWEDPERFLPELRRTVQDIKRTTCVDERRVFVVGHSRGVRGAMAAACEPWVTAVAANSYMPKASEMEAEFWCRRPVPSLWLSPTKSFMVKTDGTAGCVSQRLSLRELESKWRGRNKCSGQAEVAAMNGGKCKSWSCERKLRSCELEGGHYWPGLDPAMWDVTNCLKSGFEEPPAPRFATAEQIWSFFDSVEILEP